jgi:DNA modification methylase
MTIHYQDDWLTVLLGDCRAVMAEMEPESVHTVVTSPPYWGLRDYGQDGQLGLEPTPEAYVESMVAVFREVKRVLRSDGTVWLNLGDTFARDSGKSPTVRHVDGRAKNYDPSKAGRPQASNYGMKPKDLVGIPWRVAFALQADGWYLRSDIIWAKPNPMPESVTDRPTKAHEYLFLLSKSPRYYFDADAVREAPAPYERKGGSASWTADSGHTNGVGSSSFHQMSEVGRNLRSVWTIATQPYPGAHFATFPQALVEPCIKAGCPEGGTVLDPFAGSGTTGLVAQRLSRRAVLIDLNADYLEQVMDRNRDIPLGLGA